MKATKVKLIEKQGHTNVIIEYMDDSEKVFRVLVPRFSLRETPDGYTHDNPHMGVPVGIQWEDFSNVQSIQFSASALEKELHRNGIFTEHDLVNNLDTAKVILLGLANVSVSNLLKYARSQRVAEE